VCSSDLIFNRQGNVKYIQLTQHSRDHLRSLIDIQDVTVTTNNLIAMADLPDGGDSLRYIIDINAYINNAKVPTDPLSYKDEKKKEGIPSAGQHSLTLKRSTLMRAWMVTGSFCLSGLSAFWPRSFISWRHLR
jgi:hypothetical protein